MNKQLILRGFIAVLILGTTLLLLAGRLWYWQAWVFCLVCFLLILSISVAFGKDFDTIKQRMKTGPGTKWWDKIFWAIYGPMNMAILVIAGLDAGRFYWSPPIPAYMYIVGYLFFIISASVHLWAIWSNKFYASTVRIQKERKQSVIDSGPYRYVRHPGYIGIMLMVLSIGLVLGSLWALLPALTVSVLLLIRTGLEDRALKNELPGYSEYADRVKFRIVPGLW